MFICGSFLLLSSPLRHDHLQRRLVATQEQIEVDPPSNPWLASSAEIIGTAFYYAFGYSTVEVYLAEIDRASLVISERATIRDPLNGKRRALRKSLQAR